MLLSRAGDILPDQYIHGDPMPGRAMAIRVRLRDLLEKRGMAQTELQARSGLGYSTINALYHGKTERVEFATLEALCEVLECGVGEILEHVPEKRRGGCWRRGAARGAVPPGGPKRAGEAF